MLSSKLNRSSSPDLFLCGYCNMAHNSDAELFYHIQRVHSNKQEDCSNSMCYDDNSFVCEPCDNLQFESLDGLEHHIEEVHHNHSNKPECRKVLNWKCSDCHKTFPYKTRLLQHKQIHLSPQDRNRAYECHLCDKSFYRSADLWAHKRIHEGKTYECDICGKKLSSSGSLHNHKQTHKSEKAFRCDVCEKGFATKQKFDVHKMLHDGKKPFNCLECGKGFIHKESLTAHLRIHSGEKLKCSFCKKLFNDQTYLNRHLKWHRHKM